MLAREGTSVMSVRPDRLGHLRRPSSHVPIELTSSRELDHAVHELWRELESGDTPTLPERRPTSLRVWRQDFIVYHKPLSSVEVMALRAACGGATFGAVCERLGEVPGEHEAAPAAAALLGRWVSDGILCGASIETEGCDGAALVEVIRP